MYMVYLRLPDFTPEEAVHVKLPSDIEEAKSLGRVIMVYRDTVRIKYFFLRMICEFSITGLFYYHGCLPMFLCKRFQFLAQHFVQFLPVLCGHGIRHSLLFVLLLVLVHHFVSYFQKSLASHW